MDCPKCSRSFDGSRGMKLHHYREHGESIAGETVECDWCDEKLRRKPNRASGKNFCDSHCQGSWESENVIGEDNPLYKKIDTECENCGEKLKRKACRSDNKHFCNQECQGEWRSKNMTGEDAWAYEDGSSLDYYYNKPEWKKFRTEMEEEISTNCAICDKSTGRQNALHHVIRMGDFDNREDANFKQNVVFLCQSHHMKMESESVREQIKRLNAVPHLPDDVEELIELITERLNTNAAQQINTNNDY